MDGCGVNLIFNTRFMIDMTANQSGFVPSTMACSSKRKEKEENKIK